MRRSYFCVALVSVVVAASWSCASEPRRRPPPAPSPAPAEPKTSASPAPTAYAEREPPSASTKTSPAIPLFRRFPALAERLPYVAVGSLPTPIEKAEALGAALNLENLYIKRDDLSGAEYGGNKTRKLEFFLADAIHKHKRTVVTSGAAGSNHALATAIYAKKLGLHAVLLLMPQPNTDLVRRNLLADQIASAELRLAPTQKQVKKIEDELLRTSAPGDEPYIIEAGGSSALGNVGYVNAAFELADQIAEGKMPEPDRIYVALGTMGCAVGLRLGLMAAGLRTRLFSVRASTLEASSESKMIDMFNKTNDFLRSLDPSFPKLVIKPGEGGIVDGYLGAGYAAPTPKGRAAVRMFKQFTGIDLEPTYTGKTLAALINDAHDAREMKGEVVVFWNTYNSRRLDVSGADVGALPEAFRAYFKAPRSFESATALDNETQGPAPPPPR